MVKDRLHGCISALVEKYIPKSVAMANAGIELSMHVCLVFLRGLATKIGVNYHLENVARELSKGHTRYI